jgi:glycerol uptake facilitator-like aquaporin
VSIVSVPVTGGAINPALSIANAIYGGQLALSQLWVFIVFPIVGGLIAGATYGPLFGRSVTKTEAKLAAAAASASTAITATSALRATQSAPAKKPAAKKPAARTTTTKK